MQKTLFLGLDNSGKTSVISFLEEKLDYHKPANPTRKIEVTSQHISLLGISVKNWDFGGQKLFRDNYITDSERVFAGAKLIVFMIDIQDQDKYEEALDYLEQIDKAVQSVEKNPRYFILFHKFDPYLDNKQFFERRAEILEGKIRQIMPSTDCSFHKTSIYNRISLIRTFSFISQFYSDKTETIKALLKNYCIETYSQAAILFDRRNFILDLGENATDTATYVLELIANIYLEGIEKLEDYSLETLEILSTLQYVESEEDRVNIYFQKLNLEERLYLVTLSGNPKTKFLAYDHMKTITEKLQALLNE